MNSMATLIKIYEKVKVVCAAKKQRHRADAPLCFGVTRRRSPPWGTTRKLNPPAALNQ
jgi:hypothetical protein